MIKLYRGLVDILIVNSRTMDQEFTEHIRDCESTGENDFGVKGFWNLLLEVVILLFVKLFVSFGVLLVTALAIVFFPLYALKTSISNVLNHRASSFVDPEYVEPKMEKKNG